MGAGVDVGLGLLSAVKATALTVLVVLPIALAASGTGHRESMAERYERSLQGQLAAHHCLPHPLPHHAVARSALVRTPSGRLVLVSYGRALSVSAGRAPGTLVALCADRPPAR